jgi:glucose 1-dehydrogenase
VKALTVAPGRKGSAAMEDVPQPPDSDGPVLVEVGIYGTDAETVEGT